MHSLESWRLHPRARNIHRHAALCESICIGVCVWVLGGAGMCGAKKVVPLASCALIKQRTPAICLNTRLFITNFMELPGT
jgi:hypothetical protein